MTTFSRTKPYLTRRINGWYAKHGPENGITGHVDSIYTTGIDDDHLAIKYTEHYEGDSHDITILRRVYHYTDYPLSDLFDYWRQSRYSSSDL